MVLMASRTTSSSDAAYTDGEFSPLGYPKELYSPVSLNFSVHSQDLTFDPDLHSNSRGGDHYEDYSHIQYPPSRRMTSGSLVPPEPPLRTSSVSSFMSDYTPRSYVNNNMGTLTGQNSQQYYKSVSHQQQGHPQNHNYLNQHYHSNARQNPAQSFRQQARRKTWTPSGLKMGFNGSLNNSVSSNIRNCHSNDMLENCGNNNLHSITHINEESDTAPPRLAPVSGILPRSPARGIIKPIAFKPVVVNHNYVNTRRMQQTDRKSSQQMDDGYGSQDYPMTNQNAANTSHGSIQMESDRSTSFSSEQCSPDRPESIRSFQMDSDHSTSFSSESHCHKQFNPDRLETIPSSSVNRLSSNRLEGYLQTPSPSDSGVGELEAMLKEKDAEINTLREVMDKNERAILQVYEDKKLSWSRELKDLKEEYEQKVKLQQHKTYKAEQVLSLQVFKLQQEKKHMKEEFDKVKAENEDLKNQCKSYVQETERLNEELTNVSVHTRSVSDDEFTDLQLTVDSLNTSLSQSTEENIRLKTELDLKKQALERKDVDLEEKFREVVMKSEEVKCLKASLRRMSVDAEAEMDSNSVLHCDIVQNDTKGRDNNKGAKSPSTLSDRVKMKSTTILDMDHKQTLALQEELRRLKDELDAHRENFEKEKEQWIDEKNKVIRYQKQLQLNYVQMYRKNKMLEAEVEQLTLELESRDIKLMALNGGEESVC